ncbi:hypothetical protein RCL1_000561 [Eukaryota sp. TZLM3-RCL]
MLSLLTKPRSVGLLSKLTQVAVMTIDKRHRSIPAVQQVLTDSGCAIRARLGLHTHSDDRCSESGLIILHMDTKDMELNRSCLRRLEAIPGVKVRSVEIE